MRAPIGRFASLEYVDRLARAAAFAAAILASVSPLAFAGTVNPDLEARLAALPADTQLPVIVELTTKADPGSAALAARGLHRRARGSVVVGALRDHAERSQPAVKAQLATEQANGAVQRVRSFWVFNGFAITANEKAIRRLAKRPDVREVRLDTPIPPPRPRPATVALSAADGAWNIQMIRAPEVWALGAGYDGTGVVIGSFDTGVDGSHPDLAPRYRGNHAISWFDPYGQHASPFDNNGHGTHTTGTVVGGDLSGYSIGVAPGARWIAAKAWDDADNATESSFHEIFEWFLAPGGDPANAPDVVNSSWGLDPALCFLDFRSDVQALRAAGIMPVFAAGNGGPDAETILAPGSYAESFAVGSTDFFDDISFFSSVGPSPCDGAVKPNISAPGEFILSTFPGGDYMYLDGTSMATPHVTGAAAVLLSIDPTLTVDEIEAALVVGSIDLGTPGTDNEFGSGRLDLFESALLVAGIDKVGVKATTPAAYEAGTLPGVFTVSRTGSTTDPLTVTYAVTGTATPGVDYLALSGSVTIASGAASATIVVTPIDDIVFEPAETVIVTLDPVGSLVVSPTTATVTIVSDDLAPDLIVTAMSAPDLAGAGLAITITDTTKNRGEGPAAATTTTYYLSTNNGVLDAADVVLGSRAVPALAAGASHAGSLTVTIPAGTPPGSHYLFAKADSADVVVEGTESNNTNALSVRIGPDLMIAGLTVPDTAGAGSPITVTDTVRNQGGGMAAASNTRFYLSVNSTLDAADTMLGARAVPPIAPGASNAGSVSLTIPAGTAAGLYYLLAKADGDDAVVETLETNNVYGTYITIGGDLVVSSLTMASEAGAGLPLTITDTTRNQGAGAVTASTTTYYLSTNNSSLDAADAVLGSRAVPALAAGVSDTGSVTVTIPAGTPTGQHYVYAKADAADAVAETSESNNTAYRPVRVGPDLIVASLAAPSVAGPGATLAVTDTTRNQGGGAATASSTRYYLSRDSLIDAADVLLGARAVGALAPGASDTGSVTVTIPPGTTAGNYYLLAKADGDDALVETLETNNVYAMYITVGADLTVTAFSAPDTAGAGLTITLADTTKNLGGPAPATTTVYYLSTNNGLLDAADVVLGSRAVPALATGASDTGSVTVTIPAGTPTGSHYLFAKADGTDLVSETSESNNAYALSLRVGPDLMIAGLTVPDTAGAGATITVTDTARNQGGGIAAASNTRFYLSVNSTLDGADTMLGARPVPSLAPGASSTGSVSLTIPADTPAGLYYLLAKADADDAVAETLETNNVYGAYITIGGDLVVSSLTMASDGGAGLPLTITDTTRNQGAGTVAASTTTYYLSTNNSVLDAADAVLGSRAVPALASGASDTGSVTVTIPAGTPTGMHYVYAKADSGNVVVESSETNNTAYRTIRVGPDLIVAGVSVPRAGAGMPFTVTDTTTNQGGGGAPASSTRYYFSRDTLIDGTDVLLGARAVAALAPGASATGSMSLIVPAGTAPGNYYLLAKADGDDAILESQEGNNVYVASITVGSDLIVTALVAPDLAGAGLTITITDTTKNLGGAAPASVTTYYLSTNNGVLDASDIVLGSRAVPALDAGASDTGSLTVTIPAGTPSGSHYLFAKADGDNTVSETSETNNVFAANLRVGPDLTVAGLTVPDIAGAGATITVTDTARNQGGGIAAASTTRFYLSANYAIDGSDAMLGARAVPSLAPGASSTGSVSLTIPAGTAGGTYYLLAKVDADDAVAETVETNNVYGVYITIGPDLMISSFTVPSNASAGMDITVSDTTWNAGAGAADASSTIYYLDTPGAVLGSRAVAALAAGASQAGSATITIPPGTAAGLHYLYAKADGGNAVSEASEGNNVTYRAIRIGP
jgi:subtilase family serine protease